MRDSSDINDSGMLEVHHRVRNNLQVISSLLNLQIEFAGEKSATEVIREVNTRIQSIALLHDQLYHSGDMKFMDIKDYLEQVMLQTIETKGVGLPQPELYISLELMQVSLDCLMPLGLMINELVLNALAHGYPRHGIAQLKLKGINKKQTYELTFSDNGPGFEYSTQKLKQGLGLRFLNGLAGQLKTTVRFSSASGCVCRISLPLHEEE